MLCGALKKLQEEINLWEHSGEPEDMDLLKSKMVSTVNLVY